MNPHPLKKHRSLWLVTSLLIAVVVFAIGCQPKLTAKETYERMTTNALTQTHTNLSFSGNMGITFDEKASESLQQDPGTATMMNMFKNITFKGKGQIQKTDRIGKLGLNYDLDLNGLSMKMDVYFDEDQMIVKYPLLPQYLVLNVEEGIAQINELSGLSLTYDSLLADYKTLMNGWYPEYVKQYAATVEESSLELVDKYDFTVDGKTVSSKALRVKMDAQTLAKSNEALLKSLTDSQVIYDLLKKYDTENELGTFEEYQASLKDSLKEMDLNTLDDQTKSMLEKMTLNYVIGYDKSYRMTYIDMDLDMPIEDPTMGAISMKMGIDAVMSYEPSEIKFPELTQDNQLNVIDFIKQNMPSAIGAIPSEGDESLLAADAEAELFAKHQAGIASLADSISASGAKSTAVDEVLTAYLDMNSTEIAYVYFAGADKTMRMLPGTELPADYNPTERPFYTGAIETGFYISEPYQDATNGRSIQTIAQPVTVDGKVIGVVGIDYYID